MSLSRSSPPDIGTDEDSAPQSNSPQTPPGQASGRPKNGWEEFIEQVKQGFLDLPEPAAPEEKGPRYVQVNRLGGGTAPTDISKAERWTGQSEFAEFDFLSDTIRQVDLHRTPKGRWVKCTSYDPRYFVDELPPEDFWQEVGLDEAVDWFLKSWCEGIHGQEMPCEIREWLDRYDLDNQELAGSEPLPATPTVRPDPMRADRGNAGGKVKVDKKASIIGNYADRLEKGLPTTLAAMAEVCGCSKSQVSKVLNRFKAERQNYPNRGWKDDDGGLEATADHY